MTARSNFRIPVKASQELQSGFLLFVLKNFRFSTCRDLTGGFFFCCRFRTCSASWALPINQNGSLSLVFSHSVKVTQKGIDLHVYNTGSVFKTKKNWIIIKKRPGEPILSAYRAVQVVLRLSTDCSSREAKGLWLFLWALLFLTCARWRLIM